MPFTPLNLPPTPLRLQRKQNIIYVFDVLRKKMIVLTPEEWVRQHFLHYLLAEGYSLGLLQIERGHHLNDLQKRTDLVAYCPTGQPYLLIECKAASVPLTETHFQQVANYNHALQAPYIALTNGLYHHYWQQTPEGYLPLAHLPKWKS